MKLATDLSHKLHELRTKLGANFAIISAIKHDDYEVIAVDADVEMINSGDHFETKNTYCNEVVNSEKTVTYSHVGSMKNMIHHPIYTTIQLEAYIGEPLKKGGHIIGTLNFSSFKKKHPAFTDEEISEVRTLAREIENSLI